MNLGEMFCNVSLVVDYSLEQIEDDSRPAEIVKAICELHWPGREFEIRESDDPNWELSYLKDAFDADTGECAADLLRAEAVR